MARKTIPLEADESNVTSALQWVPTECHLNSVGATLAEGSTSATVEIWVANSRESGGVKLATMNLTAAAPSDGFILPKAENGWGYVASKITAVNGQVKLVSACVGE